MPTEKKSKIIKDLEGTIDRSKVIILADFKGVKATQLSTLRRKLRSSNSEIKVVKNTLARIAATNRGHTNLAQKLEGPLALVFGYDDVSAPVKVLAGSTAEMEGLGIRSGFLGDKFYSKEEIGSLATLPSREVLIGRVLGQMNAPVSRLVGVLASPMRGMMGVLQARIKQLEEKK